MTPERWQEVEAVLQGALDRPPQDRASFLEQTCAGDDELRNEAMSLIDAYDEAGEFIEQPAIARDARVLVGDDLASNIGHIGPYKIVERLGGGGMGEVYLAQDSRLNRLVALKILPSYFAADDARLRRFQREAHAASALNHPNILTIHEVGEDGGIYYIATEFIDGPTLRELIAKGDLTVAQILDIAEQVASALAVAHAAGIVHRDIKPENIMRRTDGLVKILDFGIAKLMEQAAPRLDTQSDVRVETEVGVVMGTVDYMSPEQARALPVDERTDLWSLGVVLYEMLVNRLPFAGATRMDTIVAILEREPQAFSGVSKHSPSDLSSLQCILDKALRKERNERYQTADALLRDLKGAKEERRLTPPAKSYKTLIAQFARPRRSLIGLSIIALLIAGIAGTFAYRKWLSHPAGISNAAAIKKTYRQMSEPEQLIFVREQEQRISAMMGDRPTKLNEESLRAIKLYVDWYATYDDRLENPEADTLNDIYARAPTYVPLIARSFAARKVPVIIGIYLPMIESAYRPCPESSLGARGLFQLLPQTARAYGVAHSEMCDAEKMTPAAARYIADGMAELGEDSQSMTLVLLSYNRGQEWVRDTLRELRGREDYERNFWTLLAHRDKLDDSFRRESAGYVPSFFAAAIIGENPHEFGLNTPPLSSLAK